MSGPKCSKVSLSDEREAYLREQREQERRRQEREEKERMAGSAIKTTEGAIKRIDALEHEKFSTGRLKEIKGILEKARFEFNRGNFDQAKSLANNAAEQASRLEGEIQQKEEDWIRRRNTE